ncbi:MAG: excisionase family DNA-binding protein [Sphingomonadales bacterium]|nr:excisionase family DNA-binding protein [Sphingomonadales bacterium]
MEPITISIADAARSLGIGKTKTFELIKNRQLEVVRIGRRTLVKTESIRCLVEAQGDRS